MEDIFTTKYLRTFTGQLVNVLDPDPESICIEDIAHALSMQPRWAGHTKKFFSVAQHSIMCCLAAPNELKLAALMHDASEAYLCDIPRPIKRNLPDYKVIEDRLMKVVASKFEFAFPVPDAVKEIDNVQLKYEWSALNDEYESHITCMDCHYAERRFLELYREITTPRGYYILNPTLLSGDCVHEVMFGLYAPEGGTDGEMAMRWTRLGEKIVPSLEVFDDGWKALSTFPDLIDELRQHDNKNISVDTFCMILKKCGFKPVKEIKQS